MNTKRLFVALLAMSAVLAGCVVTPAGYGEVTVYEPPPPRVEYRGYPPAVGYVWIDGYWVWGGHRHEWVPGRWEAPRPGYRWQAPRWERDGQHWRQQEGYWARDGHAPRAAPVPQPPPRYEPRDEQRRPDPGPGFRPEQRPPPVVPDASRWPHEERRPEVERRDMRPMPRSDAVPRDVRPEPPRPAPASVQPRDPERGRGHEDRHDRPGRGDPDEHRR